MFAPHMFVFKILFAPLLAAQRLDLFTTRHRQQSVQKFTQIAKPEQTYLLFVFCTQSKRKENALTSGNFQEGSLYYSVDMAILLDDQLSNQDDEKVFRINNGDLQALKKLQDDWGFKNLESVIAFAVGVLRQADGSKRVLVQPAGSDALAPVTPNASLLKTPDDNTPA